MRSTLTVRVAGVAWTEREHLWGAAADDQVYVVDVDDAGGHTVVFGDGQTGLRPATGAEITAEYRTGVGRVANLPAGAISSPTTRPKGLRAATNPVPSAGGADPETLDEARLTAPTTVRTFERIVSVQDVEDQARQNALVGKASARLIDRRGEPVVQLVVAGAEGAVLSLERIAELRADLDARRDPSRGLVILPHRARPLRLSVRLVALDPARQPDDVIAAVRAALLERFSFAHGTFGAPVHRSDAFVAVQGVAGVVGVDVESFQFAGSPAPPAPLERLDPLGDELITLAATDLEVLAP